MMLANPAIAHLRTALGGAIDVDQRFRATMLLAGLLGQTSHAADAADLIEEQLGAFAGRPDLERAAAAALLNVTRFDPGTRARAAGLIEPLRHRVQDRGERDPVVLGTVAAEMAIAGEPADRTAHVAARAVVGVHATATAAHERSWYDAVRALVMADHYDAALRELDRAVDRAGERGAVIDAASVLTVRSELYLRIGDLARAEADACTLHEIAGVSALSLGELLIERGDLREAARLLTDGPAPPDPTVRVLLARGRLRLAQGRAGDAVEELRECGRQALASGIENPAMVPWRSLLAHALLETGRITEARRSATEELAAARRWGALRAIGIALVAAARAAGGRDELRRLREAVAVLDASAAQLERARAHAALGTALRRAGSRLEARDPLRLAVDLAHRCGATALEERALAELRAAGARPRRRLTTGAGALTSSERRIADLAASGRQNREIADALVVTLATVEYHLRNAYRKLGIASRAQLGVALQGC